MKKCLTAVVGVFLLIGCATTTRPFDPVAVALDRQLSEVNSFSSSATVFPLPAGGLEVFYAGEPEALLKRIAEIAKVRYVRTGSGSTSSIMVSEPFGSLAALVDHLNARVAPCAVFFDQDSAELEFNMRGVCGG